MNKVAILACAIFAIVTILAAPALADSAYPGPGDDAAYSPGGGAYPAPGNDSAYPGPAIADPAYPGPGSGGDAAYPAPEPTVVDAASEIAPIDDAVVVVTAEPTRASRHHDAQATPAPTVTTRPVKAIYAALKAMSS
jgi:hypothetical protein